MRPALTVHLSLYQGILGSRVSSIPVRCLHTTFEKVTYAWLRTFQQKLKDLELLQLPSITVDVGNGEVIVLPGYAEFVLVADEIGTSVVLASSHSPSICAICAYCQVSPDSSSLHCRSSSVRISLGC